MTPPSEHEEQVGFVNWFRATFPRVRIFAIPNGGHRAMTVAKGLRDEGVSAGVPDLFVPEWCLWVEMKRQKNGKVSDVQHDWMAYLEGIGHRVILGHGARDASAKVLAHWNDHLRHARLP